MFITLYGGCMTGGVHAGNRGRRGEDGAPHAECRPHPTDSTGEGNHMP